MIYCKHYSRRRTNLVYFRLQLRLQAPTNFWSVTPLCTLLYLIRMTFTVKLLKREFKKTLPKKRFKCPSCGLRPFK